MSTKYMKKKKEKKKDEMGNNSHVLFAGRLLSTDSKYNLVFYAQSTRMVVSG